MEAIKSLGDAQPAPQPPRSQTAAVGSETDHLRWVRFVAALDTALEAAGCRNVPLPQATRSVHKFRGNSSGRKKHRARMLLAPAQHRDCYARSERQRSIKPAHRKPGKSSTLGVQRIAKSGFFHFSGTRKTEAPRLEPAEDEEQIDADPATSDKWIPPTVMPVENGVMDNDPKDGHTTKKIQLDVPLLPDSDAFRSVQD
jgi:hypothetical protein